MWQDAWDELENLAAYPEVTPENAHKNASRLMGESSIKLETARMPAAAEKEARSAVMIAMEKRIFAGRLVRTRAALLAEDFDL